MIWEDMGNRIVDRGIFHWLVVELLLIRWQLVGLGVHARLLVNILLRVHARLLVHVLLRVHPLLVVHSWVHVLLIRR